MLNCAHNGFEWFVGLLTAQQWEALRNWLGTLGGLLALTIALQTYRRNVTLKREEQARLVYARVVGVTEYNPGDEVSQLKHGAPSGVVGAAISMTRTPGGAVFIANESVIQATIAIHNGSKELIGPAKVQLVNRGNNTNFEVSGIVGLVDPDGDTLIELIVTNNVAPGWPPLGATVVFRDATGVWWRRHLTEPIEAVHDDPENWVRGPAEREAARARQITEGIPPMPEPRVTWPVQFHRLWRRARRKSPTP